MKNFVFILTLALATTATAQPKSKNTTAPTQAYSAPSTKVFGANFGMIQGAFNLGVAIDSGANTGDLGGSFFLQTEKEENNVTLVNQIMTFGGHVVMNVFENNNWVLDLRPGVNISMVSDVSNGSGGKDDKTVFGPSLRWSAAYRLASGSEIGVERFEVWNWFEDAVDSEDTFTSIVFRTRF